MSAGFDIAVESPLWEPDDRWRDLFAKAFDACATDFGDRWPEREISLLLCDDTAIRDLNRQWRGLDKPTNVLSFPAPPSPHPHAPLGDIAIAFETMELEASRDGKSMDEHAAHLAVHGLLHLLGMDHERDDEAEQMEAAERRILSAIGVADPYRESAHATGLGTEVVS